MPYLNYHSIRVGNVGAYKRIRTKNLGPGILGYGGPLKKPPMKKSGKGRKTGWTLQAIRFHRLKFSFAQAKKWMIDHGHPRSSWKKAEKATGKGNPGTHGKKKKQMSEAYFRQEVAKRLESL